MDNNIIYDKVKMKIAISKVKEEDIVMENKTKNVLKTIITAILTIIVGSGVVLAANSEKILNYFRGIGDGIDTAVENGYIENVEMESIEQKTKVESKEKLIENVNVGVKVEDFLMDNQNLSMRFRFDFDDSINEVVDLDNIHNINLSDLFILDENNVLIYYMGYDENLFNEFCKEHNLDLKLSEFNEKYLNNGLNSFPVGISKELKMAELQYNMYTDEYPKSKKLDLYFTKIDFTEENSEEKICLVGDWHITIDVPEKFYNRTEEYYKVVSCTNDKFNIYTAKVTDTCFEFGMTIDGEIAPVYPDEVRQKGKELSEKYLVKDENGYFTKESQQLLSDKYNEELYFASPYKEMLEEFEEANTPVKCSGCSKKFFDDIKDNGCYAMNSENKKFGCTMSPSRKANYKFIDDNKYDFYETFSMTKYDATDTITMIINYRGNIEKVELEKINK